MAKYMYLFRGGDARRVQESPEQMQAHMELWKKWMGDLASSGKLVDGLPLGKEGKQLKEKGKVVHDGPYAEGKEIVGGYLIVNSESLDEAAELAKGCPIFEHDGEVEVREILNM